MNLIFDLLAKYVRPFAFAVAILIVAWFAAPAGQKIPDSFIGLWQYGPHFLLALAMVLGVAYNRSSAVLSALLLIFGLLLLEYRGSLGDWSEPYLGALLITVLVPLNLAIIGWYQERGVFTVFGLIRLGVILLQLLVLAGAYYLAGETIDAGVIRIQELLQFEKFAYPSIGAIGLGLSLLSLVASAFINRLNFSFGLCASLSAYLFCVLAPERPGLLQANGIAMGLILCVSLLRDSYNMAYRDDLTGLPQRRALNELFMSLGGDYAIAMMDVDHFKKFNDTHGHDVGDDVLRLVAAQIGKVRDGGRAFRYGGEEFTVVYPSKVKEQAIRSLEEVREAIENYEMVVRAPREKSNPEIDAGSEKRGKGVAPDAKTVSVTISIGVADKSDRSDSPDDVLKKADKALYQAKRGGRNRVAVWSEAVTQRKAK